MSSSMLDPYYEFDHDIGKSQSWRFKKTEILLPKLPKVPNKRWLVLEKADIITADKTDHCWEATLLPWYVIYQCSLRILHYNALLMSILVPAAMVHNVPSMLSVLIDHIL